MTSSLLFFCNECGAANSECAPYCAFCNQALSIPSLASDLIEHTSLAPFTTPLSPSFLLAGRYHIIAQVGQGGFGVVYKAKDTKKRDKLVAVKQINLHALTTREIIDATNTYNREVTLLSKLEHANLPRVYDHFSDPEHWYLVMDFIAGETVEDYCNKVPGKYLPIKECINIGIELCEVLSYLHNQEPPIIFRDVKPANIMRAPDGHLYLIDFGIARHFKPKQAKDTDALGSHGFAAPEQYGKAQTTPQSDIYGLGATLQALLIGDNPDSAYTGKATVVQKKFQHILNQMLEMDARKRQKNISEVKKTLQALKGGLYKLIAGYILRYFKGMFISLLPIVAILVLLFIPVLNFLIYFALIYLWWLWWLVPIGQFALAIVWLCSPRRRVEGLGAFTLAVLITIVLAWLSLTFFR